MKEIKAQLQMLDNYVKEYEFKTCEKILPDAEININGQIEYKTINIKETENELIGEIELSNHLDIIEQETVKAQIKITMRGLFQYSDKNDKNKFENMLKINGATTLSHLIRAYINTNTALSGIPNIITPMINFVEFFKQ